METHYEILNVSSSASYEKIRRAYHDAARLWHPDRFVDASIEEAEAAESTMRQVNEAWRVLGDEFTRRAYDRGLRGGASGVGQQNDVGTQGVRVDDGITRIDPRLIDPRFQDGRRQDELDHLAAVQTRFLRFMPIVGFIGLLLGIIIFTAYARDNSGSEPTLGTVPGPPIGIPANACVRVIDGPQLIEVDCGGVTDGRLIAVVQTGGKCPVLTAREVPLFNEITACLSR